MLPGDLIELKLELFDGSPNKFVQAFLVDSFDHSIPPGVVPLIHKGNGLYTNRTVQFPSGTRTVTATYKVYNDALFQQGSRKHSNGIDVFSLDAAQLTIVNQLSLVGTIGDGSLIALYVENQTVVGELLGGSLEGQVEELGIFIGQLLDNDDDLIPGQTNDGALTGEIQC